jgi:hypothetical protein
LSGTQRAALMVQGVPASSQDLRERMQYKLEALIKATPTNQVKEMLEMSMEHAPELMQISQRVNKEHWAIALVKMMGS